MRVKKKCKGEKRRKGYRYCRKKGWNENWIGVKIKKAV